MIAVPKIWDILKKGVEEKVTTKPTFVKSLIQLGFAWRHNLLQNGLDSVLFKMLFRKVFMPILGGTCIHTLDLYVFLSLSLSLCV
ncbi:hypothetical protein OAV88_01905 [bacterium]|nr:hypothetical protein [bacterium]